MNTKSVSSVVSGLQLLGAGCLLAFGVASQASTLSWHDAPIMGSAIDTSIAGQFTVFVNGSPVIIPDSNALPSQSLFVINPTAWDGSHWYDPTVSVVAASSVNVALDSTYAYMGHWDFLGNGPNPAYGFDFPTDVWGTWGFEIAELYSSVTNFWLEDVGNWRYTETWTGTSGSDAGASITATRNFTVALVPEPASLALVGLALFGAAAASRRARR